MFRGLLYFVRSQNNLESVSLVLCQRWTNNPGDEDTCLEIFQKLQKVKMLSLTHLTILGPYS